MVWLTAYILFMLVRSSGIHKLFLHAYDTFPTPSDTGPKKSGPNVILES